MSASLYPTRRSVSQIVRSHTPGSLMYIEEQNLIGEVVRVDGRPDNRVDLGRLTTNLQRYLTQWTDNGGTLVGFYNVDEMRHTDLDVRRPSQVYYEPYSNWYQCSNHGCGIVVDVRSAPAAFDGRCAECRSTITQFTYLFYHRCGSSQSLRPSKRDACPTHGFRYLYFRDTRNLATSQWACRQGDHASTAFYPYCSNAQCRANLKERGDTHNKYSISYWREPWSYFTHKVDYVNLDEARAREFIETDRGRSLIHEATLGQRLAGRERLHQALMSAGGNCPACGAGLPDGSRFCPRCGIAIPSTARSEVDPEIVSMPITPYDGRVAFALLRDLAESTSLALTVGEGSVPEPQSHGYAQLNARGIRDIVLVKAFPLTAASFGFTRERSGPEAWLNAFARPENDPRIPVFTNTTTTEGWLVQLRGDAIIEWLRANNIAPEQGELPGRDVGEPFAQDWLVRRIVERDETISLAVTGLVHTYAHALLKSIALICGLDTSSLGELIWTDAIAFAIYAGETELGAMSATFEQALDQLGELLDDYASCVFDPTCSIDERGACVGCLHLTRGCEQFNANLSRAYLVGGAADEVLGDNAVGFYSTLNRISEGELQVAL